MEHWPRHERQKKAQITDKSKAEGMGKECHLDPTYWQWPHLEYGAIGRGTLASKNGRVYWNGAADTSRTTRWLPLGRSTKVFPETRPPQVDVREHSARRCAQKGLQYLRTYFPDADFPGDILGNMLESDVRETRLLKEFDSFFGNMLEIIPSHHIPTESMVMFPMGELGRELNISRFSRHNSGSMEFIPAGVPAYAFETPILQISSAIQPIEWTATPFTTLLIRTHSSSSLLRLERSNVTREFDVTRSDVGDAPIVDSRILASGPDVIVVNRNGYIYKCNAHRGGKAIQFFGADENDGDDYFFRLGTTGRHDECFLATCKAVKHFDLRMSAISDVFSLEHPNVFLTSFESPMHDHISRISTTSEVIWLDTRFRKRPLLSYKHNRNFDRTLKVLTAHLSGVSFSLLASRRNALVTLYDVNKGSDGLLRCNSSPSCLPHDGPMFTAYDGDAIVASPSGFGLTLLRLSQRGSIHWQDIRVIQPDTLGTEQRSMIHRWNGDVQSLDEQANELHIDLGAGGAKNANEVNLREAYEHMFTFVDDAQEEGDIRAEAGEDMSARLPDVWQGIGEVGGKMLTAFDLISGAKEGVEVNSHTVFLTSRKSEPRMRFWAVMKGHFPTQELAGLVPWHYNLRDTSIPGLHHYSAESSALHEHLKELNLVSEVEGHGPPVLRETAAREQLVADLALSTHVYSFRPVAGACSFAADNATRHATPDPCKDPPEIKFGYFRPVRKVDTDHDADKDGDDEQSSSVISLLGVRLLLSEWELGTNPGDYMYRDPYGVADVPPVPQYRRQIAPVPGTQKKQTPLQPPHVIQRSPVVQTMEHGPTMVQSQTIQRPHSQQSFGLDFDVSSQEPMMNTKVVLGQFGGRSDTEKKPKRRIGGF